MQNSNTETRSCLDDYIFPFFVLAPIFLGIAIYVYFLFFQFAKYCYGYFNGILVDESVFVMAVVLICGLITTNVIASQISENSSKLKVSIFSFFAMVATVLNFILFAKIALKTEFLYKIYSYSYDQINSNIAANNSLFVFFKFDSQMFHILFSGIIGGIIFLIPAIFFLGLIYFLIIRSNDNSNQNELTAAI